MRWDKNNKNADIFVVDGAYANNRALMFTGGNNYRTVRALLPKSSGKWYAEILQFADPTPSNSCVGIVETGTTITALGHYIGTTAADFGYFQFSGQKINSATLLSYGSAWSINDVIGIALDLDNGKVWFAKNNTWQASGDPSAGTNAAFTGIAGTYHIAFSGFAATLAVPGHEGRLRISAAECSYSPPSGFSHYLNSATVTLTVKDEAGAPINSTAFKWAFFDNATPDALALPVATGTTSTNGAGVLTISIGATSLPNGGTGSLLISTTGGTAGAQCRSWYMPVNVTV